MPKFADEKYKELIAEQAKEFNKRMAWINKMPKLEKYKGYVVNTVPAKNADTAQVDLRDMSSLASLLPLRGETEQEQEANLQEDVYNMAMAFQNGTEKDYGKYLDMLIDITMNFNEDNFDFNKKEDVYKACCYASLGQCLGTKKGEFQSYYDKKINTPALKEKFYYATLNINHYLQRYLEIVNKSGVPLDISVTLYNLGFDFDRTYNTNSQNAVERDIKQYQKILNKETDVTPLEYVVNPEFFNISRENMTSTKASNITSVMMNLSVNLLEFAMPGGTEDKAEIERCGYIYLDCVFVNGKPVMEAVEESRFNGEKENIVKKATSYLAEQFTDPNSVVEICKLIPIGAGQFKKQFVPLHNNFSLCDDKTLQDTHDVAFKAYTTEGYKQHREEQEKYVDGVLKKLREKEADLAIDEVKRLPDLEKIGSKPDYEDYDDFFVNDDNLKANLSKFEDYYNACSKYYKISCIDYESKLSTIEKRQGNGMALIMAGKDATLNEVFQERIKLFKAYQAGGEYKREYNRQYIKKTLEYDLSNIDFNKPNGIYEYITFVLGSSAISNIFEEDKELEKEFTKDPLTKNAIALRGSYTNSVSEFLGGKLIEATGSVLKNSLNNHMFDVMKHSDASTLMTLEAKRFNYDITHAKIDAIENNKQEHTLVVPYFLAGNAGGSQGSVYTLAETQKSFDDYITLHSADGNDVSMDSCEVDRAEIETLALSAGCSLAAAIEYSYQIYNTDNIQEFAKANKLESWQVTDLCTYIDGRPLKELIDEKEARACELLKVNKEQMNVRDAKHLRESVRGSLIAEALANPEKTITQVYFKSDANNILEVKSVLLKKDYSAFKKQADNQHSVLDRILHFLHLKTYDEEVVVRTNNQANEAYKNENKAASIVESFKTANKDLLAKHQLEYAVTEELKQKAFKELNLSEKIIRNVREQFLNDNVEVEKDKEVELSNRPNIGKTSTFAKKMSELNDQKKYADNIETENFNKKFEKKVEQIEIVLTDEENNDELEKIVDDLPDSPEEKGLDIEDLVD